MIHVIFVMGVFIAFVLIDAIEGKRTMRLLRRLKKSIDAMNEQTQQALDECRK